MLDETSAPTEKKPWEFGRKWNDVDIQRVRAYWAAGKSKKWIGVEMGKSRGAVSGLVNRHHMESPNSMSNRQKDPASSRKRLSGGARRTLAKAKSRVNGLAADVRHDRIGERPELPPPSDTALKAFGVPCSLVDLGPRSCKWPLGHPREPDFAFCNAVTAGAGAAYCVGHREIAGRMYDHQRPR